MRHGKHEEGGSSEAKPATLQKIVLEKQKGLRSVNHHFDLMIDE